MRKPYPYSDKRLFRAIAVETVVEKVIRVLVGFLAIFLLSRWNSIFRGLCGGKFVVEKVFSYLKG
jgi:hypothetical protein